MQARTDVVIADDEPDVVASVREALEKSPRLRVVAEAADGDAAWERIRALRPHIAIIDIGMPGIDGIALTRKLREHRLSTDVILLTVCDEQSMFDTALELGVKGYLLKHSAPDDVLRAIRQAHAGETALHPAIARMVLQDLRRPPQPRPGGTRPPTTDPLSERELEVLRLVARGMSNQEIADTLVVGEATVRSHVSSILRKLQVASRTQAALHALLEGRAGRALVLGPEVLDSYAEQDAELAEVEGVIADYLRNDEGRAAPHRCLDVTAIDGHRSPGYALTCRAQCRNAMKAAARCWSSCGSIRSARTTRIRGRAPTRAMNGSRSPFVRPGCSRRSPSPSVRGSRTTS